LATEALCPRGLGPAVRAALAAGAAIVQLREKDMPERRLVELGRRVRVWTRETDAVLIMNDRADLAVATDADGVHVGQDELPVKEARAIVGPRRLVGVSTHSIEQARQAVLDGADYLGVGPVFPSATKAFDWVAGLELVRQVAAEISLPWFAIGGINAENIAAVLEAGATRIAVSHAILSADDPGSVTSTLCERLNANAAQTKSDDG
jgi:thiamine-phosphate pyrophosphorylase